MITATGISPISSRRFTKSELGWIGALAVPLILGPVWALNTPEQWGFFGSFVGFQLLFLLGVSTVTDIQSRKIYNSLTYSSFLIVLAASMLASLIPFSPALLGSVGLGDALSGSAVCFFIVFLAYQMTGCGAGDVKMATVIGAMLGWRLGLSAVGFSYIAAAIAALGSTVWSIGPQRLVSAFLYTIAETVFPGRIKYSQNADRQKLTSTIPMAPFFAVGTILAILELI
jgi:prepilin signal peptidase PulO-like enzyme (type II secretory pathway)